MRGEADDVEELIDHDPITTARSRFRTIAASPLVVINRFFCLTSLAPAAAFLLAFGGCAFLSGEERGVSPALGAVLARLRGLLRVRRALLRPVR